MLSLLEDGSLKTKRAHSESFELGEGCLKTYPYFNLTTIMSIFICNLIDRLFSGGSTTTFYHFPRVLFFGFIMFFFYDFLFPTLVIMRIISDSFIFQSKSGTKLA